MTAKETENKKDMVEVIARLYTRNKQAAVLAMLLVAVSALWMRGVASDKLLVKQNGQLEERVQVLMNLNIDCERRIGFIYKDYLINMESRIRRADSLFLINEFVNDRLKKMLK